MMIRAREMILLVENKTNDSAAVSRVETFFDRPSALRRSRKQPKAAWQGGARPTGQSPYLRWHFNESMAAALMIRCWSQSNEAESLGAGIGPFAQAVR
jgi:hypothetical protein